MLTKLDHILVTFYKEKMVVRLSWKNTVDVQKEQEEHQLL